MHRLANTVAVVTGAANGIGAACARRLAEEGAAVVICDIVDASEVAAGIVANGGQAIAIIADVSHEADWDSVVSVANQRFGRIDILVSNAYMSELLPAHKTGRASWDQQLAVSLTGTFLGVRACLPDLRQKQGVVVVVSSIHAFIGFPNHPAYAAAKGGLVALGKQLAVEYGPQVRVNSILPGPILTRSWADVSESDRQLAIDGTIARRLGEPAEVAAAVAFLASSDASFITGTTLIVDGGMTAFRNSP